MTTKMIRVQFWYRGMQGRWVRASTRHPKSRVHALEMVNGWEPVPGWKVEMLDGSGAVQHRSCDKPRALQ